ncbi:Chromosomal replication initiator protein DnaA [Rubripirellula amarantea]|uniref:Chromosomal replication initiator protein DnaA n=1 Tax=Rubripirellula amarantea TaxID=2527999 RepID=A0A5C5WJ64_9BACT|nr:transposase [Rubripirellula amarantea]TWT50179.1 Chromosomal replication initiator protein DnaA [Rubripirellula amarantea]
MARQLRVQFPGAIYHVVTRGDGRRQIFHDDGHYDRLTRGLKDEVTRSGWKVLSYCWMPNHIHLLVQTPEPNLASGMQHWLSGYANWYSKRNQRVGHLFQGRYKSFLVEDAGYLWSLSRYIHLNPCNGTRPLAQDLAQWTHSSYPGYARKTSQVDWVQYDELHTYWLAQNGGKDPAAAYRQYVKAGRNTAENPLASALGGWVLGSESFLKKAIALAQSDDDQKRQRTTRRLKAVTAEQIIEETAFYYDVSPQEYVGFRSLAPGRELAALLCRRWTGETIASLSRRFGLAHPDSASNLVRRAKVRIENSKQFRKAIEDIEYNLGLKTENLT